MTQYSRATPPAALTSNSSTGTQSEIPVEIIKTATSEKLTGDTETSVVKGDTETSTCNLAAGITLRGSTSGRGGHLYSHRFSIYYNKTVNFKIVVIHSI
jgi:hypothetical protein